MMHFNIICVGKIKEAYLQTAIADYVTRLSKYVKIDIIEVPEDNSPQTEKRIEKEGEMLLKRISSNSCIVALDLHGKEISSEKLAEYISNRAVSGCSDFSFVIGGSDGISKAITSKADMRLCLSPMTFTHQMIRLIIAEQLYRAMKINNGEQYHK